MSEEKPGSGTAVSVDQVASFWGSAPCGSDTSSATDRRNYFLEIERERYHHEPHIPEIARFAEYSKKRVLEVGCGVGTDGRQFAAAGADYTGINVDVGSTLLAREGFELFQVPGTVLKMNGEKLEFEDATFDHVYSFGVIHHSPDTQQMVREMYRVLKPGGTVQVMVYYRDSINYRFEIMFLRKIMRHMLRPRWAPALVSRAIGLNRKKLERHREIMMQGATTPERWLSINTDGPDCPLAKVYSKNEAKALFDQAGFTGLKIRVRFFDARHYGKLGRLFPSAFTRFLGKHWGWHLIVDARKPV